MPDIPIIIESGRTLIYDGLAQNDVDMANHRLLHLDTSNLPPIGIPPTITPPDNQWLHSWDAPSQTWIATRPEFVDIGPDGGTLTGDQQQGIEQLGRIRIGEWQASVISGTFLTTLDRIRAPIQDVNLAGFKLTSVGNPVNPGDAVNLGFMDFMLQGLQPKEAVRCASTTRITPLGLEHPIDGVELEAGDRVLAKDQSNGAQNGIYIASTGNWDFAEDFNTITEMERAYCAVLEGDTNSGSSWVQVNEISNINTSPKHFILFSSTPGATILPGQGLTRDGNTLNVVGTANRIVTGSDNVDISSSYAGQTSITTLGTIATGIWHGELVTGPFGGTGVDNGIRTITLAGHFSTANALDFPDLGAGKNLAFILVDHTSLTLPEAGTVATLTGVETFNNKRIVKRASAIASNSSPTIDVSAVDVFYITDLTEDIVSMTDNLTGTATDGQELAIWIKDNTLTGNNIEWGTAWIASTDLPLPTHTSEAVWLFLNFTFRGDASGVESTGKWVLTQKLDNIP